MDADSIQTDWNLGLLYESPEEDIEEDIEKAKEAYQEFADTYRDSDAYLTDPEALREALEDLEHLGGNQNLAKPIYYYKYRKDLDVNDQQAESQINQLKQLYAKLGNKIRFFELKLGNVPKDQQEKFLSSDTLEHYYKYLRWLFKKSEYNLSEDEENLLSRTSLPRNDMWVDGVRKTRSQKMVDWKGDSVPITEASSKISDLPTDERRELHNKCMNKLTEAKEFAESEINAVITDKKITDEIRGYEKPYSATVLRYENTTDEVETLVETVTENFDIAHRFYELKAQLLDEGVLTYADRSASIGSLDKDVPFAKAANIVHEAFSDMDDNFANTLESFLQQGQIDAFPKEDKRGGAFCSWGNYLPTYVFLNHVPNFKSITTLAHEMGHAIHGELSKQQTPFYREGTISSSEVASTFFEGVVFNKQFKKLDKKQQLIALHDKINRDISTIFRQIACFNFEKQLHAQIREAGSLSHEAIAELMNEHMANYLGDRFDLVKLDGYFFIKWSHIRRPFYVYTYAYGDLISKALHKKYKKDNEYIEKIKQFLQAGSRQKPQDIFADIGVDTSSAAVFKAGLSELRDDLDKLEELIESVG